VREVGGQIVPGADQKTRLLLRVEEVQGLEEHGDALFRMPGMIEDGGHVDNRPAGPVAVADLEKARDRLPQQFYSLFEPALISPQRAQEIQKDGALQRISRALLQMVERPAEGLFGAVQLRTGPA